MLKCAPAENPGETMFERRRFLNRTRRSLSGRSAAGVTLACLLAMAAPTSFAEEATLKDGAKNAGHAVGSAVREVGKGAKKAGKAVGKAAKEGGKEFRRAVKGD